MCEAPAFHHGPRPLVAEVHARASAKPRRISLRARVRERFHRPPQQAPQLAPQPAVQRFEHSLDLDVTEIVHPTPKDRRQFRNHPASAITHLLLCLLHRLTRMTTGPEAETRLGKARIKSRTQDLMQGLLNQSIRDRRDTQHSLPFAVRLGDQH